MQCGHTPNDDSNKGGTLKKSWDTKKVRPAYIRERVVTPRSPGRVCVCIERWLCDSTVPCSNQCTADE
ncbi:hypothetical protein T06_6040 [Trichinella sp. T6]|nr:hypothetical protein T06_6040 [Trichinella sp. T6]